jgi:hypothetical protein
MNISALCRVSLTHVNGVDSLSILLALNELYFWTLSIVWCLKKIVRVCRGRYLQLHELDLIKICTQNLCV